jgi:bacillithiol biosynthesis deacetylase BshB1
MPRKKRTNKALDVLAVGAHPDDVELTCGGTLIRCVKQGYRVGILDLTRGEMGTRGTPEQRAREAAAAARTLGVHHRENLGLPDARLEPIMEYKLAVAERIRALRPRVVILPYWDARHPDHSHACQIGYEGCYLAGLAKLDLSAPAGKPHRPHKVIYSTMYDADFRIAPSFVVDISPYFKQRMRAVACYRSQFHGPQRQRGVHIPLTGLEERVATYCGYFGQLIGVAYGEPFVLREALQVDDIVALQGLPL